MTEFPEMLKETLNRDVNKKMLSTNPSGFNVCGYNESNLPEFHIITNIGSMRDHIYSDFHSLYFYSEDFLRHDAHKMGWNGINPQIPLRKKQYYINGDVRTFHAVWKKLDSFFDIMMKHGDFSEPRYPESVRNRADWKVKAISSIYKRYASTVIIEPPVDTLVYSPSYN